MFAIGGFLMISGALQYDMFSLAGISQLTKDTRQEPVVANTQLNYNGILGIIRHPWYLAAGILIWASDLGFAELIRNIILDSYLIIGAFLEEKKLVLELGDKYRAYQRQVPMFIPYKLLKR